MAEAAEPLVADPISESGDGASENEKEGKSRSKFLTSWRRERKRIEREAMEWKVVHEANQQVIIQR